MRTALGKLCKKCGADDWYRCRGQADKCAPCQRSTYKTNPQYRAANAIRCKAWAAKNQEKIIAYRKRQYAADRENRKRRAREFHHAHREYQSVAHKMRLYGLTLDEFHAMLEAQGELCAICKVPMTPSRGAHVDHDHRTKQVRGLLCGSCNNGLGRFKDDPTRLRRAARYLEA